MYLHQIRRTSADPTRVDIRGTLTAGQDVFVDVGVVFEGECIRYFLVGRW